MKNSNLNKNTKIIVGLSGGVDSSVATLLLLEQGYDVEALFMKNWEEDDTDGVCTAEQDLSDAQKVADKLGVKLHTINFSADYWDDVFDHFLKEHKKGRTPNPDVLCNQKIKFKVFLEHALSLGADKIATGHYARIHEDNGIYQLQTGLDENKDQSYFLHLLNQQQLSKSLFPLGEINKDEVRQIATENDFVTADKKDSTGICFIGERNFSEFLQTYLPKQQGNIVDQDGQFIKYHKGLAFYTMGQRKGLEIGGGFGAWPCSSTRARPATPHWWKPSGRPSTRSHPMPSSVIMAASTAVRSTTPTTNKRPYWRLRARPWRVLADSSSRSPR
jgi:tRNA-specific 2-thiouridylase